VHSVLLVRGILERPHLAQIVTPASGRYPLFREHWVRRSGWNIWTCAWSTGGARPKAGMAVRDGVGRSGFSPFPYWLV